MSTDPSEPRASAPRLGRPRDWLIGAVLLIGLILAVDRWIGWPRLLAPWASLAPPTLALLVMLNALSYLARAARVAAYFQPLMAGRFATTLRLSVLHTTGNVLLPMRLGEFLFPWLMGRYFGHGFLAAGASLLWIRLLDLHFLALIGFGILWLRQPHWAWIALALIWLLSLRLLAPLSALGARLVTGEHWLARALRLLARTAPPDSRRVIGLYLWTALCWSAKFLAFAALLQHFVPIPFWQVLAGVMGAELSSVLPFHGIAASGSYELATLAALVPLGVSAADALAGAVNLHLFMLGATLLFGLLALLLPIQRPAQ